MDDILALFRKGSMHQPVGLIVALLTALQAPISWKKAQLGPSVTWCGWTFCFRTETVALVQSKLEKLRQQLQKLSKGSKVAKKDLEACLGLLNWATTLSPHMRSFMSCLYKDLRSLRQTCLHPSGARDAQLLEVGAIKIFSKADVPRVPPSHKHHQWVRLADPNRSELHLKQDSKFALAWLSLCFQHEQPCSLRTPPLAPCLSAADAFADKHRMGIGGWLSTATDFVWYSEIFTDEEVRQEWPQLSGSLQHYIACFETLAQLALAHCSWSLLRAKHIALSCPAPATRCQPPFYYSRAAQHLLAPRCHMGALAPRAISG